MKSSLIAALLGILLASASAARSAGAPGGLAHLLARARLVVSGEVVAVEPYDSGRITVAHVQVAKLLKGDSPAGQVMVVERHDLPSRPDLLRAGDQVVLFLVPATRNSSLKEALPAGSYHEPVEGRSGVLSSRSVGDVQEAAGIIARLVAADRAPVADAQRRAAGTRALVFDEISARLPAVVADGVAGLGSIADLATTLSAAEQQRLEAALDRTDLPTWVRVALVNAVAERGLKVLVPVLRKLPAPTPELQRASWDALVRLGATPSADELAPAVTNADPAIRAAAAHGLVAAQGATAIPQLTTLALTDPSRQVQVAAIEALGQTGPAALPSLERAFASSDSEVRQAAARTIYNIGGRPASETFARLAFEGSPEEQKYAVILLLMSGVAHDDPLLENIRSTHPDEGVRRIATEGLEFHEH